MKRGIGSNPRAISPTLCRSFVVIYRTDSISRELDAPCVERPVPGNWSVVESKPSRKVESPRETAPPRPSRLAKPCAKGVCSGASRPSTTATATSPTEAQAPDRPRPSPPGSAPRVGRRAVARVARQRSSGVPRGDPPPARTTD